MMLFHKKCSYKNLQVHLHHDLVIFTLKVSLFLIFGVLHGAQIKNAKYLKSNRNFNTEVTDMCKTAIEREFYEVLANNFKNCENSTYEAQFAFFWQMAESCKYANYEELGNLRTLSNI